MASPETDLRMRPVYCFTTEGGPEEYIARLELVASFDPAVRIQRGKRHAVLRIPDGARHTWSPTLDVHASPDPAGTHIHARVAPAPEVWTLFVFCYAVAGAVALSGAVLGFSQHLAGASPWGLVALPVGLLLAAGLYAASIVGRGLGAHQIHQLLACLEASLGDAGRPVSV